MKKFLLPVWEVLEMVLAAGVTVFLIKAFLIKPFLVSGASMEPNFHSGDYLIIDEISYQFKEPKRGEAIVFRYPKDESAYYIKRIVGLPGEKVILKNSRVKIVNGERPEGFFVDEEYLSAGAATAGDLEVVLGRDEYFVLGDNRNFSFDSRSWGSLPKRDIVGLVRLRLWPVAQAGIFDY